MLEIISWMIIGILNYIAMFYAFSKITNIEFKIPPKNFVIIFVATIIYCYFRRNYSPQSCVVVTNISAIIMAKIFYKKSIAKTLISFFLVFICYAMSEVIFACVLFIIPGADISFSQNPVGNFISNIIIILILAYICQIKRSTRIIKSIIDWSKDNDGVNTALLVMLAFGTCCAVTYPISSGVDLHGDPLIYAIFFLCTVIFVLGFFKQKSKNNELSVEYDHLLEYVKIYEKELDSKSKKQHEYKNQLIILKGLLNSHNKKAEKYITDLVEEGIIDDDITLLGSLKNVPDGGLKGLIYFKLLGIKGKNSEIHINVSSKLSNKKLWKTCLEELGDISKIIGVFLDNAIEALNDEKEKYLIIDIDYEKDTDIIFSFSNTCTKHIDFQKFGKKGYTTKGENHGYGLSLVRDIVSNNELLETKKEINGKFFVQHLYVHIKK